MLGYKSATYKPAEEQNSIRDILDKEVKRFARRFLIALVLEIPILLLVWMVPYTWPHFLTSHQGFNGMPLYIFLMLGLSTII